MTSRRLVGSFGRQFEQRGEYKRALDAYHAAGEEQEVKRIAPKAKAIEQAEFLERNACDNRAVRILVENGLLKEALSIVGNNKSCLSSTLCAQIYTYAACGTIEKAEDAAEQLYARGPRGHYLLAKAIVGVNPYAARYIADKLSGKEPEKSEDKDQKTFLVVTNPEKSARTMVSLLHWDMSSVEERLYYALLIYQKLGDRREVMRCFNRVNESDNKDDDSYFFHAAYAINEDAVNTVQCKNYFDVACKRILKKHGIGGIIDAIERWYPENKKQLEKYKELIDSIPIEEYLTDEDVIRVVQKINEIKGRLAEQEKPKLKEANELLKKGDFASIKKAEELFRQIDFGVLDKETREGLDDVFRQCADAASELTKSKEAQAYAGSFYARNGLTDKALACASRLLQFGAIEETRGLYLQIGETLEKEERDALAQSFENDDPLLALRLYQQSWNGKAIKRIATKLLSGSITQEECQEIVNALSVTAKESIIMRDALERLESFGDEARRTAESIRVEMRIPNAFIVDDN